jgi:hypothetical protein
MKRLVDSCLWAASCLAVGCSSSDPATEADYDDVAQSLSSVVAAGSTGGDVGAMSDSADVSLGATTAAVHVDASGKYVGSHIGLSYEYTATCTDAAGGKLAKCGSTTDDSTIKVAWSGDLALPSVTAAVQREGTWKLSNIQSGTVSISGDGEFTLDAKLDSLFRNVSRTYHVGYSAEYADVEFDLATRHAESGSVSYVIDAERTASGARGDSDAKFHMNGVLAFNADGSATLTLDHSFSYRIDTVTGLMVKEK